MAIPPITNNIVLLDSDPAEFVAEQKYSDSSLFLAAGIRKNPPMNVAWGLSWLLRPPVHLRTGSGKPSAMHLNSTGSPTLTSW